MKEILTRKSRKSMNERSWFLDHLRWRTFFLDSPFFSTIVLILNFDEFVKSHWPVFVIPAPHQVRDKLQRESRELNHLWTPAFTGVTALETFYETIEERSQAKWSYSQNDVAYCAIRCIMYVWSNHLSIKDYASSLKLAAWLVFSRVINKNYGSGSSLLKPQLALKIWIPQAGGSTV